MVYYGTNITERIMIHPAGEQDNIHFIEMTKFSDAPMFGVSCCCDEDWYYTFWMENNSDYERVKFNIMESIATCDNIDSLLIVLSKIFEDGFSDIIVKDDCEID